MSKLSLLRERLGQPARDTEEFRVSYGSPARYLGVAKRQVEQMLLGDEVAIDLPMLEDATAFESELHELGIITVREAPAAAAEG
jgi:hypothetical protein